MTCEYCVKNTPAVGENVWVFHNPHGLPITDSENPMTSRRYRTSIDESTVEWRYPACATHLWAAAKKVRKAA